MRIALAHQSGRSDVLELDLVTIAWKGRRKRCRFYCYDDTGLPPPFERVFLKLWEDRKAFAHSLLDKACGREIPGTPQIFGIGRDGDNWLYVFQRLPDSYKTLDEFLEPGGISWITPKVMRHIVRHAVATFKVIGREYRHVYTDFCSKNIMLERSSGHVSLIDLDSAWSEAKLKQENGRPDGEFDTQFWALWENYLRAQHMRSSVELIPRSVVLSFAAVWGYALGLLAAHPPSEDAERLRQFPHTVDSDYITQKQDILWRALSSNDRSGFQRFFGISMPVDDLFGLWHNIFGDLTKGHIVGWERITAAAEGVASLYSASPKTVTNIINQARTKIRTLGGGVQPTGAATAFSGAQPVQPAGAAVLLSGGLRSGAPGGQTAGSGGSLVPAAAYTIRNAHRLLVALSKNGQFILRVGIGLLALIAIALTFALSRQYQPPGSEAVVAAAPRAISCPANFRSSKGDGFQSCLAIDLPGGSGVNWVRLMNTGTSFEIPRFSNVVARGCNGEIYLLSSGSTINDQCGYVDFRSTDANAKTVYEGINPLPTNQPPGDGAFSPRIVRVETFREGTLVFFRLDFTTSKDEIEGFGFRGINGSPWAEENHFFSHPGNGRVSPGRVEYPFNLQCGTVREYESDIEAWIFDRRGRRSPSVWIHLACPGLVSDWQRGFEYGRTHGADASCVAPPGITTPIDWGLGCQSGRRSTEGAGMQPTPPFGGFSRPP